MSAIIWKRRIARAMQRIQPATQVAERVASVVCTLQKPTVMGVLGAVSAGANALHQQLNNSVASGRGLELFVPVGALIEALTKAGVHVRRQQAGPDQEIFDLAGAVTGWIDVSEYLFLTPRSPQALQHVRAAVDRVLAPAVEIRGRQREEPSDRPTSDAAAFDLTTIASAQAVQIWGATRALLADGPRCILLTGRPGVGKTTAAQAIAREAGLGRTVVLDGEAIGSDGRAHNDFADSLSLLSPGVVIVDDVDKARPDLHRIEAIRKTARLVILTANNGEHDDVLDGALARCGRIDEVFSVEPEGVTRRPPFDKLPEDEWAEVSQWPVAYVIEVERRLRHRPEDLRLDDLRERLERRVRSGSQERSFLPPVRVR